MNIQFKNSRGELSPRLQEKVERKLAKLARHTDTPENKAHAFFELERAVGSQQTGNVWQATLNIDANGTPYYAAELADSPEKAADRVLKEIRIELKKARGKRRALTRREGGFWKTFQQRLTRA